MGEAQELNFFDLLPLDVHRLIFSHLCDYHKMVGTFVSSQWKSAIGFVWVLKPANAPRFSKHLWFSGHLRISKAFKYKNFNIWTQYPQNIFPSYSFYIRCAKLRHAWFRDGHQSSWTHMAILNTNSETGILEISWDHDCLTFTSSQDSVIPFPEFFQTFWEFTQQYLRGEVWNQSALLNFFQFLIYIMRKSEPPMDLRYEAISKGPEAMIGLISALVGTEHLRIQATVTPYALQFKKLK